MKSKLKLILLSILLVLAFVPAAASHGLSTKAGSPTTSTLKMLPGQTATLLPDGTLLMLGGETNGGPTASAAIFDPITKAVTPLNKGMQQPRAWHSATVLPDGTVLIFGGIDAQGDAIGSAEGFDLTTHQFRDLPPTGLTPRAYHTATLLTDGQVLIIGGSRGGETLGSAEIWDPSTNQTIQTPGSLQTPRSKQTATLLPDGNVLVWGGVDAEGRVLQAGEVFSADQESFTPVTAAPALPGPNDVPNLAASLPKDGDQNVGTSAMMSVRFSKPLQVRTISSSSLILSGPTGPVSANVSPAEGGMLAFLLPKQPLQTGDTYTVSLSGLSDTNAQRLPDTQFSFTTAPPLDSDIWTPQVGDGWQTWRPKSPSQSLPPLQAPPGVTAIAGQALKLNGQPLPNVTLSVEGMAARTDQTGRFLLKLGSNMSGQCTLVIDGSTANRPGRTYGLFEWLMNVTPSVTNVLPFTIWMTALDMAHAVSIPAPTTQEMLVTTPLMPGLALDIPPNSVIKDRTGNDVHQISITPIPLDRPPFPLPDVQVPIYFTIQPGGARIYVNNPSGPKGARLLYPNTYNSEPGTPYEFWNYDAYPNSRWAGWYVYGQGKVSQDGKDIIPNPGVFIHGFTGAMVGGPSFAPSSGANPGCSFLSWLFGCKGGDPLDLGTGLFVYSKTDLMLPDVLPIVFKRIYRPGDPASRSFGKGALNSYDIFLVGNKNPYTYQDLVLADGSQIYYPRISSGTGWTDAVYQETSVPGIYYGSKITWNGNGWTLTLKNGTTYTFPDSANASSWRQAALIGIRDRYGNAIALTRDSNSDLTVIKSSNGRYIKLTYDSSNRITQAQDNAGRTVNYAYDSSGRLFTVTDPNGGVTTYTYDSSNEMLTIKDARNITYLTNQYDSNGRVIKQTLADGSTFQFAYTLNGNGNVIQTNETDPNGDVEQVNFNSPPSNPSGFITGGMPTSVTYAQGTPVAETFTNQYQSGTDMLASIIDPLGRTTSCAYDNMGNVTSITRLAGTQDAVTTSFTYDPTFNQLTGVTDPLNHTTSFGHDARGNMTSITDPVSDETTLAYNYAGQPTSITDPLNNVTQFSYSDGDLVGITDPLGRTTSRFVDAAGRLVWVTDPMGQTTLYSYDPLNELTQAKDPMSATTTFAYDPNGNLLSVEDAKNNTTSYTYNNMDRRITRTDPLLRAEGFQYDANGNLTQVTDQKGQVTTFNYDALNRKSFAGFGTQAGPTYQSTISYTYDAGNRLTQAADTVSGTINLGYDDLNRLTSESTPQGSVAYTYDNAGRRTSMTVAGQTAVNYSHDNDNRLTQITQGSSTVGLAYDNGSRRATLTLPNGVVMTYSYDQASELSGITYKMGTTTLGDLSYTYDGDGRRATMGGSLAQVGLPGVLSSATYDAANELTQWDTTNVTYDANGNLTGDGVNTYAWDARNQLTSVTDVSSGTTLASFQYDAFGRRTENAAGNTLLYDGVNAVQELSGTTPVVNRLTGGVDEFFGRTDSGGTTFPLTDALGSTIALTDSSGAIQTQYAYEPFGATTPTGATSSNWYQFTGRENDGTGLYYYRARYYSPRFQRFISEDPVGFGGGDTNLYGYVREDPINFTDPGGNTPVYSRPGSGAPPTSGRKDKCYTVSCYAKNIAIGVAAGLAFAGASAMAAEAAAPGAAEDIAAAGAGRATPSFLGQESGPLIPVPEGATGPIPTANGLGDQFVGGSAGNGLAPSASNVRVMDPTVPKGPSPGYPNGYVNYTNSSGQTIDPYTGRTVPPSSPWWHIPLGP